MHRCGRIVYYVVEFKIIILALNKFSFINLHNRCNHQLVIILSVFVVGKREPSYSTEGRYSITEHHRLRFSERLMPVLTMGFHGALDLFFKNFETSLVPRPGPVQVFG